MNKDFNLIKFNTSSLYDQINTSLEVAQCTPKVRDTFQMRLHEGSLSEDENPDSHVIVYMVPIHTESKTILLVHNVATNLWLAPGGHVSKGESLTTTVKREAIEELEYQINQVALPFLLSLTKPTSKKRHCKQHLDIWFPVEVDNQSAIIVDREESNEFVWIPIKSANDRVSDISTRTAIDTLCNMYP